MKSFHYGCGNALFFDSTSCLRCVLLVGYDRAADFMRPLAPGWRFYDNAVRHGVCNWLLPADCPEARCPSCRLNRTIPDLSLPANLWAVIEAAKRRLVRTFLQRLPSLLDVKP